MNNEHYNIGLLSMNSPHPLGYFESLPSSPVVSEQVMSTLLLYTVMQVVQEYERAVIFRLGRLPAGGSKGPGEASRYPGDI